MLYLDTSFYSALANANKVAVYALKGHHDIAIPLPVIAELRYGFVKGSQREKNESLLQRFLAQPNVTVMIPSMKTTAIYADLQLYCSNKAVVLSHNDLWIASLTKEGGGILMTCDKDFLALKEPLTEKLFYTPIS
jgi:predicted nucleic acid-binding protein